MALTRFSPGTRGVGFSRRTPATKVAGVTSMSCESRLVQRRHMRALLRCLRSFCDGVECRVDRRCLDSLVVPLCIISDLL